MNRGIVKGHSVPGTELCPVHCEVVPVVVRVFVAGGVVVFVTGTKSLESALLKWCEFTILSFQAVIKEQLQESQGLCEYAVYVQGMSKKIFFLLKQVTPDLRYREQYRG